MEKQYELIPRIASTRDLKIFMGENRDLIVEIFKKVYEGQKNPDIVKMAEHFYARAGVFTGSVISFIMCCFLDFPSGQLISGLTGAYGLVTGFASLTAVSGIVQGCETKAQELFNELMNSDDTLFKSIERGRFMEDTSVQEQIRAELQYVIDRYNSDMEQMLTTGTWASFVAEDTPPEAIAQIEEQLGSGRK